MTEDFNDDNPLHITKIIHFSAFTFFTFFNIVLFMSGIYKSKYNIGKEITKLYNEYSITVN